MVRTNFRNGWIHQCCDIATSMAKTGCFGSSAIASGGSRKLTWLSAMMALGPALSMFSRPFTSSRKKARNTMERKSCIQLAGMVRPMTTATTRLATPMTRNRAGVPTPSCCTIATRIAPTTMKAALSTLTAATTRGAAVGAGPGLHRREGRHDEQAARDREAGEIDGDADAAAPLEHVREPVRGRRRRAARMWSSRDRARTGRAARRRSASAAARCARREATPRVRSRSRSRSRRSSGTR